MALSPLFLCKICSVEQFFFFQKGTNAVIPFYRERILVFCSCTFFKERAKLNWILLIKTILRNMNTLIYCKRGLAGLSPFMIKYLQLCLNNIFSQKGLLLVVPFCCTLICIKMHICNAIKQCHVQLAPFKKKRSSIIV